MATIEKIHSDLEKTKEKIVELQKKQKVLEEQLVEEENLEIVRMVKAVRMTSRELSVFLKAYASGMITLPKSAVPSAQESSTGMEGDVDGR